MAAFRLEKFGLRRGFDAFGNDFKPEIAGHYNDGTNDSGVFAGRSGADLLDETPVDLYPRERIARQIAQRCIPGAEIVERDAYTFGPKCLQRRERSFLPAERDVLGDFKLKSVGRQAAFGQGDLDVLKQRAAAELGGEKVYPHAYGR